MRPLPLVLAVLLAACQTTPAPRSGPAPGPDPDPAAEAAAPEVDLRATLRLDHTLRYASFELSRDGYLAIVMWRPGGPFELVYPVVGAGVRQWFEAGEHEVRTTAGRYAAPAIRVGWGPGYYPMPTYFALLVAERPLDVDPFEGDRGVLRGGAASLTPAGAARFLAEELVPEPEATEWTVAFHVDWPEVGGVARPGGIGPRDYRWIACPGGVIVSIPAAAVGGWFSVCPPGRLIPLRGPALGTDGAAGGGQPARVLGDLLPERPRLGPPSGGQPGAAPDRPKLRPRPSLDRERPAVRPGGSGPPEGRRPSG